MRIRDWLFRFVHMPGSLVWLLGFVCALVATGALLSGNRELALSAGLAAGAFFLVAQLLFGWRRLS